MPGFGVTSTKSDTFEPAVTVAALVLVETVKCCGVVGAGRSVCAAATAWAMTTAIRRSLASCMTPPIVPLLDAPRIARLFVIAQRASVSAPVVAAPEPWSYGSCPFAAPAIIGFSLLGPSARPTAWGFPKAMDHGVVDRRVENLRPTVGAIVSGRATRGAETDA